MHKKFIFFDSHPIQYNSQIYAGISRQFPEDTLVVYQYMPQGGQYEADFGKTIKWGIPLTDGFEHTNLGLGGGLKAKLRGYGAIFRLFRDNRPKVAFLHTFSNPVFPAVVLFSLVFGTRVWLRADSNDIAFKRSGLKSQVRGLLYVLLYKLFDRFFYVGQLNREHYLNHGVPPSRLTFSPRCVADPAGALDGAEKRGRRLAWRETYAIDPGTPVVMFVGKFIRKKNPEIIFTALESGDDVPRDCVVVMVGSGPLEADLAERAARLRETRNIRTVFAGFKDQVELVDCYLGADILVLPSLQSGETWGLVVNEALQAGQAAVVSNFVGCGPDFAGLERVRIFDVDDPRALAAGIAQLSAYPHDFDWARAFMAGYSMDAAVQSIASELSALKAG